MEIAKTMDLSREDILKILHRRQLNVGEMQGLSHEELVRVYNTFVVPLSRRPQRFRRPVNHYTNFDGEDDSFILEKELDGEIMAMDVDTSVPYCKDVLFPATPYDHLREKRKLGDIDLSADYQYHLSRATKRIKLDSCF